jgi:hypothetical protein
MKNQQNDECIYTLDDLQLIFPFGRSKLLKLCREGVLPVVKVGKTYISNKDLVARWLLDNEGRKL